MNRIAISAAGLLALTVLGGCADGVRPYAGAQSTIANTNDSGRDTVGLADGKAAIVYDPDGCQAWLMDDGLEGYSGRRFDPKSGLPICDDNYAPGTIVKDYQTETPGYRDFVPTSR